MFFGTIDPEIMGVGTGFREIGQGVSDLGGKISFSLMAVVNLHIVHYVIE